MQTTRVPNRPLLRAEATRLLADLLAEAVEHERRAAVSYEQARIYRIQGDERAAANATDRAMTYEVWAADEYAQAADIEGRLGR